MDFIIAFLLGNWLLQQLATLPNPTLVFSILFSTTPLLLWWRFRILRWIISGILGFAYAWGYSYVMLNERLASELEGQDLIVEGWIASIPKNFGNGLRFDFDTSSLTLKQTTSPWRVTIRLTWYEITPLTVGERWRFAVRLKRPFGLSNPATFDQEGWLFHKGIRALGNVRTKHPPVLLESNNWYYTINRLRQQLANRIAQALTNSQFLGLIQGLALGETNAITYAQRNILNRTGTNHLLAISGSHIILISGLIYFIIRRIWRWSLWIAAPRAAASAAISAAWIYAALSGLSIPTQRAVLAVSVAMIALIIDRIPQTMRIITQVLFIILLWDPLAVIDAGFWLSFTAVIIIIYSNFGRPNHGSWWWSLLRTQWWVTLGLMPINLIFFHELVIYSFISNLIAIPWIELGTVPIILGGTLFLPLLPDVAENLLWWADISLSWLWRILEFFANLPLAVWAPAAPQLWTLILAMISVTLILAPRGLPGRWLGLIGCAPLILTDAPRPSLGELWLTVLDVGQGLSAIVRTKHHTLVYDAGPKLGNFDSGIAIIAPFLRYVGRPNIDVLLISHFDNDHNGGANSLIHTLTKPQRILSAMHNGEPCQRGINWNWDGIDFHIIHPLSAPDNNFSNNDTSCVLHIKWQNGALLLTGDISKYVAAQLAAEIPNELNANVIIAPHHGSRNSLNSQFVDAVKPQIVIYSTGYRNRFGFPHQEVVNRYREIGAQSFNTAQHGAIEIHFGINSSVNINLAREQMRHYWNLY